MKEVIKQRLVGALILLALGVIFWPIIFVDPATDIDIESLQMPSRPEVASDSRTRLGESVPPFTGSDALPPSEPDPQSTAETAPSATPTPDAAENNIPSDNTGTSDTGGEVSAAEGGIPQPGETREVPMAEPQMDSQGLPIVWTLQLVTLSDGIKAEALRQDLLADGHKAYVKAVTVEGKALYRVHIGPKAERAQLEALQAELDSRLGVSSMIRRYLP